MVHDAGTKVGTSRAPSHETAQSLATDDKSDRGRRLQVRKRLTPEWLRDLREQRTWEKFSNPTYATKEPRKKVLEQARDGICLATAYGTSDPPTTRSKRKNGTMTGFWARRLPRLRKSGWASTIPKAAFTSRTRRAMSRRRIHRRRRMSGIGRRLCLPNGTWKGASKPFSPGTHVCHSARCPASWGVTEPSHGSLARCAGSLLMDRAAS
jgi:hypothetical protein